MHCFKYILLCIEMQVLATVISTMAMVSTFASNTSRELLFTNWQRTLLGCEVSGIGLPTTVLAVKHLYTVFPMKPVCYVCPVDDRFLVVAATAYDPPHCHANSTCFHIEAFSAGGV